MPSLVSTPAESVTYSPEGVEPFAVHRLTYLSHVELFAPQVTGLVKDVYSDKFEHSPNGIPTVERPLSPGSVDEKFGSIDAVENQVEKLRRRLGSGGNYWYVSEGGQIDYSSERFSLIALANTTLSKDRAMQKLGRSPANCYLGNVLVRPNDQRYRTSVHRMRYGSAIMHAAIKFGGFDVKRRVATDVLAQNTGTVAFFENAALSREEVYVKPMGFRNRQQLRQVRYSGVIEQVIETIEEHLPMLAQAVPLYRE